MIDAQATDRVGTSDAICNRMDESGAISPACASAGSVVIRLEATPTSGPEAFDEWRENARIHHGVREEWRPDQGAFCGVAEIALAGPLRRLKVRSSTAVSYREDRHIGDRATEAYLVCQDVGAGCLMESGPQSAALRGPDLFVLDFDRPSACLAPMGFALNMLLVPKRFVDPHLKTDRRPSFQRLSGGVGLCALASQTFQSAFKEWDAISWDRMGGVADAIGRLIAVACGESPEAHAEAVGRGRFAEAEAYIAARLSDPSLSAAKAAAALKMSERSLAALFERHGASFAARVRDLRIRECRAALIADPSRSVTDIALAWGFGSVPSFYRAFQTAYGVTPTDLRQAALSGPPIGP